jgi:hypothetical protein
MEKSYLKNKQKKPCSIKVCALCGKASSGNWARHWKNNHPGVAIMELQPGDIPTDPYDESWLKLIEPISLRKLYMTTAEIEEFEINEEMI